MPPKKPSQLSKSSSQPEASLREAETNVPGVDFGEDPTELYDHAPAGYLTTFPDGEIVRVNETFAGWSGYSKAELRGRKVQDLFTFAGRVYFETHLAPLLRMQGEASEIAVDIRCRGGHDLPVLMNWAARAPVTGAPQAYRVTVFNASERRRYERELLLARRRAEDASRMKSDLLAMLGHDIRTPLGTITNVVRLLATTKPSPQQGELLEILKRSSESLLELINDILAYSTLEAGKLRVEERPFAVRDVLRNLVTTHTPRAAEKNLRLDYKIDERVPVLVYGDAVKISQVLMNLVGNAIKFTSGGGVELSARLIEQSDTHATIEFTVADTGIGIEHDQLRNIFEEFTQANEEIGLKYGGTGLGLAISRKLLALFESTMRVTTEPGVGSSFSFELKLKVAEPGTAA